MQPDHTSIPTTGRVLGLDWGTNRIGIAVTDPTQLIATPLATLARRRGKRLPLGRFLSLVEHEHPVGLVVGLPLNDESEIGSSAALARDMGELFARRSGLPLEWVDESFTTTESIHRLTERGISPQSRRNRLDAMAAAVLLERWIAQRDAAR